MRGPKIGRPFRQDAREALTLFPAKVGAPASEEAHS